MSFQRMLIVSAAVGAGVPALCWTVSYFFEITFSRWTTYVWPSSVFLMATDGHERTPFALLVVGIAVLGNVILYMLVGALAWYATRALQRGTTTP
jgi:hypothetical protein